MFPVKMLPILTRIRKLAVLEGSERWTSPTSHSVLVMPPFPQWGLTASWSPVMGNSPGAWCPLISQHPSPSYLFTVASEYSAPKTVCSVEGEGTCLVADSTQGGSPVGNTQPVISATEHLTPGAAQHANTFQRPGQLPWRAVQTGLCFLLLLGISLSSLFFFFF